MLADMPPRKSAAGPLWLREAATDDPDRLTRDRIVATAIELADAEGLEAVSIRRIATELSARPMSLYAHIGSKDDLLDLMHDRVVGEALLGEVPDDWREALRAIARTTRAVTLRHPWVIEVFGRRPRIGPNTLRHGDESAAAVAGLDAEPAAKRALLLAVDTYTIGHVTLERSGALGPREADEEWRRALAEYVEREVARGELPHLAELDVRELIERGEGATAFEQGLEWLLAGATAQLDAGSS
jgi:AcrR family transcriptional regulator